MRYIAYYRVSTKRQGLGLEAQASSVHQFISTEQGAELIAEYSEKESGKDDERPELEKALRECREKNAVLLLAKLDRLSRRVSFIFALKEASVRFRALDMPEVQDVLTLAIYAGLAEQERLLISTRTKAALQALKAQGVKLGNPNGITREVRERINATIGEKAKNNSNNRQSREAALRKKQAGYTIPEIVRYLNDNGYKTSRGCEHNYNSVKRLLQNLY